MIPTPMASIVGLRSSQTNTQPDCIERLSSTESRRETIRKIPRVTAWNMMLQSAVDRTRRPEHVGRCTMISLVLGNGCGGGGYIKEDSC